MAAQSAGPSGRRSDDALRSKPAEKARPAPRTTIAKTAWSAVSAAMAALVSSMRRGLKALSTRSRLNVRMPILPSRSTVMH